MTDLLVMVVWLALLERGERVIPAAQNRGAADNREVVAEVRELRSSSEMLLQRILELSAEIGKKTLAKQTEIVDGFKARANETPPPRKVTA